MENVNFELYKIFYYVAINQNLTRAAESLFISQPAVTQAIKKLEQQIGYSLFYRTKHGMNLTKEGEIIFEYLKFPIECLGSAKKEIENKIHKAESLIRLGGGNTVIEHNLLKPLQKFRSKHQSIDFVIKHDRSTQLIELLIQDQLDLIILTNKVKTNEEIECIPIEKTNDHFVASIKEFGQYKNEVFTMKELNSLPLILQSTASSTRKFVNQLALNNGTILHATYELARHSLVLAFIKAGLGIGFINSNHIEKELKEKKLFELKTVFEIPPRYIYVAIHRKNKSNKILQEFIDTLKK